MDYSDILRKYMENTASEKEVRLLEQWLHQPENERLFEKYLEKEWDNHLLENAEDTPNFNEVLNSINSDIDFNKPTLLPGGRTNSTRLSWQLISGVAAVVTIFFLFWVFIPSDENENLAAVQAVTEIKSNPKGQKSVIVLRDGSRVKLNADSELSFPETFSDSSRIVYLKGEAFFEIARDVDRPFTVVTENIATTALGTTFNVKAFPEQADIEIVLATGKVKVVNTNPSEIAKEDGLTLDPHFRATFSKANHGLHKDSIDVTETLAWKDGILYFQDARLDEIREKLERWYNVEFTVLDENRWGRRQFTGSFDNESLKNVLEGISFSSKFKYHITGRKVLIEL